MKVKILLILSLAICSNSFGQFIAKLKVPEKNDKICDIENVIAIFPGFEGQEEAIKPISKSDIQKKLNVELTFLNENHKYRDKGMINLIVNCKGEVVRCKMDLKTKNTELDEQIENVFNSLGEWKPAKLNGNEIDSSLLFSFKIKKGKITLE